MDSDRGSDGRFVRGNVAAVTHGMDASRPILREVLDDEMRAVWDACPCPGGADGVVEGVIRTWWVMQYRVMKWQAQRDGRRRGLWGPGDQARVLELMARASGVLLKAMEVHVRVSEASQAVGRDASLREYLSRLTPAELAGLAGTVEDLPVGVELGRLALSGGDD